MKDVFSFSNTKYYNLDFVMICLHKAYFINTVEDEFIQRLEYNDMYKTVDYSVLDLEKSKFEDSTHVVHIYMDSKNDNLSINDTIGVVREGRLGTIAYDSEIIIKSILLNLYKKRTKKHNPQKTKKR